MHLNCHSTCPLPRRILLSKRTSRLYESLLKILGGRFASAKRFCCFEGPHPLRNRAFRYVSPCSRTTGATMQTGFPFKLFPYSMDRAEDLHAVFFCIALALPKTSAKTNWSIQTSKIRCGKWCRWTRKAHGHCHSTCPLAFRVLLSKRTSRLYESLLKLLGGRFASARRNHQF